MAPGYVRRIEHSTRALALAASADASRSLVAVGGILLRHVPHAAVRVSLARPGAVRILSVLDDGQSGSVETRMGNSAWHDIPAHRIGDFCTALDLPLKREEVAVSVETRGSVDVREETGIDLRSVGLARFALALCDDDVLMLRGDMGRTIRSCRAEAVEIVAEGVGDGDAILERLQAVFDDPSFLERFGPHRMEALRRAWDERDEVDDALDGIEPDAGPKF